MSVTEVGPPPLSPVAKRLDELELPRIPKATLESVIRTLEADIHNPGLLSDKARRHQQRLVDELRFYRNSVYPS